jgi:hypothetical protein
MSTADDGLPSSNILPHPDTAPPSDNLTPEQSRLWHAYLYHEMVEKLAEQACGLAQKTLADAAHARANAHRDLREAIRLGL